MVFAMALGWKSVPILLILLIFWKNAVGYKGWSSHAVQSNQNWPVHNIFSPRGAQSSVLEAPVTGSNPLEEVASNGLAWKQPNANRSRFSLPLKYVKSGLFSSSASMSPTQSAPSSSVSASLVLPLNQQNLDINSSLLQLQGSSIQDIANQSGLQLGDTSSPLSAQGNSSTGSSASSLSEVAYTAQDSSGPQLANGSSQLGVSGLLPQSPSTASETIAVTSVYTTLAASPLGVSQFASGLSPYSQNMSGSQSRAGTQLSLSSSFQPQGTTSQYAPTFSLGAKVPVSSQYYPATQSGSLQSLSQPSQKWQPLTSRTNSFQPSSTVASQGSYTLGTATSLSGSKAPSKFSSLTSAASPGQFSSTQAGSGRYSGLFSQSQSASRQYIPGSPAYVKRGTSLLVSSQATRDQGSYNVYTSSSTLGAGAQLAGSSRYVPMQTGSTFTNGSSLQLQGTTSKYDPAAKVPVYRQAAPSGSSLSLSQLSQLKPSTSSRWSQGFQTSGIATSQTSSSSQGSKSLSSFSTLTSAASPGQFSSTLAGSGRYSGLSSESQSASSQYSPGSPTYAEHGSSVLDVSSQATREQDSYKVYTSSSTPGAGAPLAGSSRYVPMQTGSTFTNGSSLQLQDTTSKYEPAALVAKFPVYNQAAPSGSSSLNRPSQWQPSISRWSQGFQTSDTATSQSSSPSQGLKSPSNFSTLTSAASPGQFSSTPVGSGRYSGLSSESQSASSQYNPGSPAYTKRVSSLLDVSSQATRDQGSYKVYTSSSTPEAGAPLAGSRRYVPMQTGSLFTDGSPLQLQGTTSKYAPAALDAKVPVYRQAAPSGSLSLSQLSQLKPSTSSRWSQGFQTSGIATSQTSSSSQGSKSLSSFSTLTSAASPGQFSSTLAGSGRYNGLSSESQSASSQYSPGSPTYAEHGSSVLDVSSQATREQDSYKVYTSSSTPGAGAPLAGSSRYVPMQTGSTFTYGSSLQLQGTTSKYEPAAKVPVYRQAAPSGSSLSLSQLSQLKPSTSRWSQGFQTSDTATSQSSAPSQGSKSPSSFSTLTSAASPGQFSSTPVGSGRYSGLSSESQSASSQYNPGSPAYTKRVSSLLDVSSQATRDQGSYKVYTSSSTPEAGAPLAGSRRYVPMQTGSLFTDGSSLQLQGTTSKYAPAALDAKVPVYRQAAPSWLSDKKPLSQLKPSTSSRWSQGFQTSGTVASQGFQTSGTATSQTSAPSQGSKSPSSFSTLTSAASPGQFSSTPVGSGRYSGLSSESQSASSQYNPGSPAYTKRVSSHLDVSSQATRDQGSYVYLPSSTRGTGAQLEGSTFTDGSSLQLQGTTSKYEPAAKFPAYNQAAPSGSSSLNRPSQWQPSISRWSQGFQTSGTVASQGFQTSGTATSQTSAPSQGSKSPSSFSTLTSAASPGQFSSTPVGSGRYSGLSSESQSASSQYNPGSPAYTKRVSSHLDVSSQATRDQGSYVYLPSSTRGTGAQLEGSTFTDGSSLQLQGTASKYEPALDAKVPVYSQAAPSGSSLSLSKLYQLRPSSSKWSQGFQATGTAVSQSSSSPKTSQLSTAVSFMPALGPSVAQSSQPSMLSLHALHFGSVIRRQKSPGLFASVQRPTDSVTSSLDSNVQAASQGIVTNQSSDPTVVSNRYSSTYIQKPSGYSSHSQSTSASGRHFSSVKG